MRLKTALIIFDWDGTLVDSAPTIARAIQLSCQDLGLSVPSTQAAQYVIGLGLQDALAHIAPGLGPEKAQELSLRFRHHYLARDLNLVPFEGVVPLLSRLRQAGLPLAVATGKSRAGLDRAFLATQTGHFFSASRCADESVPKPGPEMVIEICEMLQVDPQRALVIGDTTHDLQMAHSAGAQSLAVTYGAHPEEALRQYHPLGCMSSVAELSEWLHDQVLLDPHK